MRLPQLQILAGCILLLAVLAGQSDAQTGPPYVINTLAGGGPNNLPALSSSIGLPTSIAQDATGNIYFVNNASARVFKVDTSGTLTVVAGNGVFGYSGDGGPAKQAELSDAQGVFVDGADNIFIADTYNNVIREVSAATGNISTVAGTGTPGYSGDGGLATQAELFRPYGVTVDLAGNIYIADTENFRIREVSTATGNISTVAGTTFGYSGDGGLATQAKLNFIGGIFVDGTGNIFIADTYNNVMREVYAATGIIQTVVGNSSTNTVCGYSGDGGQATQAELCYPDFLFVDGAGNLYIADAHNNVVRGVSAATGNISTVAGNNICGYSGDGGLATQAELCSPAGVFLDATGDLFIADYSNSRIREVFAATGNIQTVVGNGTLSYSGDGHAATDAELSSPAGMAVDSSRNVFFSDAGNNVVREVVAATGDIQTVAGNGTSGFLGDGQVATQAELSSPTGLAVDRSGNVYVHDSLNSVVRAINTGTSPIILAGVTINAGDINTIAGNGTSGYLGDGGPATQAEIAYGAGDFIGGGVAVGSNGIVYIADAGNNRIRAVNTGTATVTIAGVAIPAGFINTIAGNGTAGYTGDQGPATSAELNSPFNVGVDASGNVYVTDSGNSVVRVINPGVNAITVAGISIPGGDIATVAGNGTAGYLGDNGPAINAELNFPNGVAIDASGNIFVSDTDNFVIREVAGSTGTLNGASAGTIITIAGTNTSGFSGDGQDAIDADLTDPLGIGVDSTGRVVFSDNGSSRVRELTPTSCQTTHTLSGFTISATVSCTGNFVQGNQNQFMGFQWGDGNQTGSGNGGGSNCGVTQGFCTFSAVYKYMNPPACTPTSSTCTVTPTVIDASGNMVITTGFMVNIPSTLAINPITLPGGTVGVNYTPTTLTATGGTGSLTWSIVSASGGLPAGLTLNPTTGVISGMPTTAGTSNFTVQVEDTAFDVATLALSITIAPPLPLKITTTTLPGGTIGALYSSTTLQATGGVPPYSWTLASGSTPLPPGIGLSTSGIISGTPNTAGTFNFTVQVTDTTGAMGTQLLSIAVTAPAGAPLCQPPTIQVNSNTNPLSVTATSNCTDATGSIASTTVDWGDGASSSGTPVTHTYSIAPSVAKTYTVTVTATDTNGLSATASGSVTVTAGLGSVVQGQPAQLPPVEVTAPIGVPSVQVTYACTSVNGPNGAQSFNSNSYGLACNINPQTVTLTATSTTVQITVTTTSSAGSGMLLRPAVGRRGVGWLYAVFLPLPGIALLGIGRRSTRSRKKKIVRYAALALLGALMCSWLACGSSITPPPSSTSLTPSGQYAVSVTGTSSGSVTSSTITVGFTVTIGG